MPEITRELLHAYLDDALDEAESSRLERALRDSDELRQRLRSAMQERDRGEHSLGAIWRRRRLSCPPREQLGSFLLGVMANEQADYLRFHVEVIGCPFCAANLADLKEEQARAGEAQLRRQRIFRSSASHLRPADSTQSD